MEFHFVFRMKELEDDAIRAQAVIVKAQELQDSKQAAGNIFDFKIRWFRDRKPFGS